MRSSPRLASSWRGRVSSPFLALTSLRYSDYSSCYLSRLNLTAGRRVYLMEPFWNPAVEVRSLLYSFSILSRQLTYDFRNSPQNQAVDRIYRLGQTMPVQTVRFIMKHSIEANMLKIQRRKMDLAQ